MWPLSIGVLLLLVSACAMPPNHGLKGLVPPPLVQSRAQVAAVSLVNGLRAAHGVGPLAPVAELNVKAQAQAQRMAAGNHLFHSIDLTAGISLGWRMIGENVALAGDLRTAEAWLERSAPHRANLLKAQYSQIGTGVVVLNGNLYLVQDFVGR
jgi:uncharacterized protein YkwD